MKKNKPPTLTWKQWLELFVGAILIVTVLDHFRRPDLARPMMVSIVAIGCAIRIKWELRRHVWFWLTMTDFVAVHIVVLLLVPWTTQWVAPQLLVPFCIADLYAMNRILSVIAKRMDPQGSEQDRVLEEV